MSQDHPAGGLSPEEMRRRSKASGWMVVFATFFVLLACTGSTYSFTAFFGELQDTFGASRGAVAQIFSIVLFVYHIVGAGTGVLADRIGSRTLVTIGVMLVGLGFFCCAAASSLVKLYLAFGLIGVGIGFAYVPSIGVVPRWFFRQRAFATGIAVSGIGVGTLVMPILASELITRTGWRTAFFILGVLALCVGGVASMFIDGAPEKRGFGADGTLLGDATGPSAGASNADDAELKHALRSPTFWLLYLALLLVAIGQFVPFVHLVPFARDHGIAYGTAVVIFGLLGVGSTLGRLCLGRAADKYGRRTSLVAMYIGMTAILIWWMTSSSAWQLVVFSLVFGLFYGGFVALVPAITADYFGSKNVSGIIGVLYTAVAVGTLIGPRIAGDAFDLYGSYHLPIAACAMASSIAAAIIWFMPDPRGWSATKHWRPMSRADFVRRSPTI